MLILLIGCDIPVVKELSFILTWKSKNISNFYFFESINYIVFAYDTEFSVLSYHDGSHNVTCLGLCGRDVCLGKIVINVIITEI